MDFKRTKPAFWVLLFFALAIIVIFIASFIKLLKFIF